MMIFLRLTNQLELLHQLLFTLSDEEYCYKIQHLRNASIGAHTRHILELLECATEGYCNRKVDYTNRKRNLFLETDRLLAINRISAVITKIEKPDIKLVLITEDELSEPVSTTYFREVVYNTEHTIHHLALIRVGLIEMGLDIVSDGFGVANATIKHMESLKEKIVAQ